MLSAKHYFGLQLLDFNIRKLLLNVVLVTIEHQPIFVNSRILLTMA